MNKSEKERLARRQRMLAREQGQAPEAGIRGTGAARCAPAQNA